MNYETLQITIDDRVASITLNRPERLNSFDMKLGHELYDALQSVAQNNEIRAVVLRGTGKGFCGGGDVKEMHAAKDKPRFLRDLTRAIHRCVIEIRTMEKPVIAAVNGAAFGAGLSLALACDMIVAVKDAKMSTAFIGIGLAPGCGTQFVTKLIGYQRACEYILTSKTFTAEDGYRLGMINKVVDAESLDAAVEEIVSAFRSLPPIAVGKAKLLINKGLDNDMISHLELESKTAAWSAGTEDFNEGVTAFVEKRKPVFKGK
ncbi:MAG TPA: 2-(1,2-epoxy-1,2-dihydrophenyl)acetyl-CoA isomerase [Thermoplasmata archaeon]|jgi:2-(1,2-epoxy-1,2-dihydrophenyl)acetyl-CoA isomerase|nr:MAG TPA: 2-(1,2-epoxy-1,2-dihydrophenyl)acetyl-CoA isomerase [Thermoplasmata archaeon]